MSRCWRTSLEWPPSVGWLVVLQDFPGKQRVIEAELREVANSPRIQNPVQMIDFVLHHAGVKVPDAAIDQRSCSVEAAVAQLAIARHQTAHAGDREAAFPVLV